MSTLTSNHSKIELLTFDLLKSNNLCYEILSNCNDGINIVDLNGNVIYANSVSAEYANTTVENMIGKHISEFYSKAVLLNVLKTHRPLREEKIHYIDQKKYVVNSYPIFIDDIFCGAYSIFKDIQDIEMLNRKIQLLELHLKINKPEENLDKIIGNDGSLSTVIQKAKRTVGALGGPRHSIISGQSGTGKTMLATLIYNYAKHNGVIKPNAPFIEINCAQFTNSDIAAMEIFGSEDGAFTGSRRKKGLFEQADGGILFLDEAHALENYQNLLLKAIESGKIRRIGGTKEVEVNVILIAASTKNLENELLPELYQRLAQYEMYIPALHERSIQERNELFDYFIKKYEEAVKTIHGITYNVTFSEPALALLINAYYPRNIRQFRDIINYSIDAAAPLISEVQHMKHYTTVVDVCHLPELFSNDSIQSQIKKANDHSPSFDLNEKIMELNSTGMGPRRISTHLLRLGHDVPYYKVAYVLKKNKT